MFRIEKKGDKFLILEMNSQGEFKEIGIIDSLPVETEKQFISSKFYHPLNREMISVILHYLLRNNK